VELFRRLFLTALIAGALSGLFTGIVHQFTTVPIIRAAEVFERAAAAVQPSPMDVHHDAGAWQPGEGAERISYTMMADVLAGIGFSLLLVAGFAVAGARMDWRTGFYWGVAAFAAFMLAPGLGLPPEIPGTTAAPLADRQWWWLSTVLLTLLALALLYRGPAHPVGYAVAVAMVVLPHAIGAPQPSAYQGAAPELLAHRFVVATMLSGLLSWLVTGTLAGALYRRLVQPLTSPHAFAR
jgi:cobalt transporter subunit CbtA